MRYISLFSGIEAASVAWRDLQDWEPVAFCEIDKFPSAVLAHRFPGVPNLGDITKVDWREVIAEHGAVDLVVGGSPCQSFSIAGGRESLGGESRLMFEYIRAIQDICPTWLIWENVPGVLNTRDNAFAQLLEELSKLGYGLAWRSLDAQFFGVAQRRKRVFVVGYIGSGGGAAAVLFDRESVCGNTLTSKEKRAQLAKDSKRSARSSSLISFDMAQITNKYNGANPKPGQAAPTLHTANAPIVCMTNDTSNAAIDSNLCGTLLAGGGFAAADCVGSLCARDYKGIGNQDIDQGKIICELTY